MAHERDCAKYLLKYYGLPNYPNSSPDFIYCATHGLGSHDIAGMFDVDIWIPYERKINIRIACSSHDDKKKSIEHHDLLNKDKYILGPNFIYYLVTWQVYKHRMRFRIYSLPFYELLHDSRKDKI